MNLIIYRRLLKLFGLLAICTTSLAQQPAAGSLGIKGSLLWNDEFNYTGLPDTTKWDYEEGFVRNNEKQYYTRARKENCFVQNGNLIITSLKEHVAGAEITSASINTLGKKQFEGDFRVEVKAKLPSGKGIWPAIWMMGVNIKEVGWPKCSEIDIMEFVGHTPGQVWGNMHWWDSTASNATRHLSKGGILRFDNLHTGYHIYGLERKADKLRLFVDDIYYLDFSVPSTAYPGSFTSPLYLLLNTAVGGAWGGEIDESIFPQQFYIDYVRVFQLK